MSPFHLNRKPSVPLCLVCACKPMHSIYRCIDENLGRSYLLLPYCLRSLPLPFVFFSSSSSFGGRRETRGSWVVTWSARLSLHRPLDSFCVSSTSALSDRVFFLFRTDSLNQTPPPPLATSTGTPASWEEKKKEKENSRLLSLPLLHPALGFAGTRRIKPGRSASQHRQSSFNSSRAQVLRRQLLELSPHESIGVFDLFRYYIHHTTAQVAFFWRVLSHLALIFRSSDQCDSFSSVLAPSFSGKFLLFSTLFSVFITELICCDVLICHLATGTKKK